MSGASPGYEGYAIFTPRRKPFLIWLGPLPLALLALSSIAFEALVLLDATGTIAIGGVAIDRVEYALRVLPASFVIEGSIILLAYGLFVERNWARVLAVWLGPARTAVVLLVVPAGGGVSIAGEQLPYLVAFTLAAYWYFYRKASVVRYYRSIDSRAT